MSRRSGAAGATSDRDKIESVLIVQNLSRKLSERGVKVASLVSRCEDVDRNNDNLIHENDLYKILIDLLGKSTFSQREMSHLSSVLETKYSDGQIDYRRLYDILESDGDGRAGDGNREDWYDEERAGRGAAASRGSVGEWLQTSACPAEVKNFKRFIACLEEFERISGMKCVSTADGFTVPLGPDLKASVKFFMS